MPLSRSCTRSQSGFTLIEAIITVALIAILVTTGIPMFEQAMLDSALSNSTNRMVTSLGRARAEALRRGVPVTLCPANATQDDCDASKNWRDGWIAFVESAGTLGSRDAASETLLLIEDAVDDRVGVAHTLVTNGFSYLPDGSGRSLTGQLSGNFLFCHQGQSENLRTLTVRASGSLRLDRSTGLCTLP